MHFDTPTAGSLKLASSSPALEKHGCLRAAEELQPARSARAVTNQRPLVFETFLFPKKREKKDEKNTVATAQIPAGDVLKICI